MRRLSRPWLTQGLRCKQPPVPDCFSLLETVLAAVLLVVTTLSTYSLFQVNMNVSKFSHELDAADRDLSGKMQEIRELGKTFKWCAKAPSQLILTVNVMSTLALRALSLIMLKVQ